MRRVLIVSPHFPPVNAPDMQRVRMALPHLRALGWEPTVLAIAPEFVEGAVIEPLLEKTYPADIRVVRVGGVRPGVTRRLGFGSLWLRCGSALRRAGDALLASRNFDLVFFSTTLFPSFGLGPRWLRRFGVPYALDYQDPWVNDYYARSGVRPPGGPLRYWFAQYTARRAEPGVLRRAAGVLSVSPVYLEDLRRRAPDLASRPLETLPFAASPTDFTVARAHPPARPLVPRGDGFVHIVSTGRGGADLARGLGMLFRALHRHRQLAPAHASALRFHFIGTDYAPAALARPSILPVAERQGVADLVDEHCTRVPYFEALHYLAHADVILVAGSDDPSYSASKLQACLLAGRPLLCVAHSASPLHALARARRPDSTFGFAGAQDDAAVEEELRTWLARLPIKSEEADQRDTTRPEEDPGAARAMTRRLVEFFERSLAHR